MKGVQCYELFGGITLKNNIFSFFSFSYESIRQVNLSHATRHGFDSSDERNVISAIALFTGAM